MSTFSDFRNNLAATALVQSLVGLDMSKLRTWDQFTRAALEARPARNGDYQPFIDRVERRAGTASTGELALLMAVLFAMDYRWLAERIAEECGRSFMRLMEYTTGDHAQAASACIERRDDEPSAFDLFEEECLSRAAQEIGALQNTHAVERTVKTLGPKAFSIRGLQTLTIFAKSELQGEGVYRLPEIEPPTVQSVATEQR